MLNRAIAGLALLCLAVGCGGGKGEARIPTIPVKGKLLVDGKPAGPVLMNLSSNPPNEKIPVINAYVKADGTFVLKTYEDGDGAPEGKYDVRLTMDPMSPGNVPGVKPATIEIKKPASGTLDLEVKLEGTGQMVSPLPMNPGARQ